MEEEKHAAFAKANLAFGKVVATPTETSWSQAYNAGTLFAVLSLKRSEEEQESLNTLGKEVLARLEQEYFTLEKKDLASIKQAVTTTFHTIPAKSAGSFLAASIIPGETCVLYVFAAGGGKALLKRQGKIATILVGEPQLQGASGFLAYGDTVILQTQEFARAIPNDVLLSSLDNASAGEVAENLAVKVHETKVGGAAAIIVSYQRGEEQEPQEQEPPPPTVTPSALTSLFAQRLSALLHVFSSFSKNLNHPRRVFLSIAIVLLLVLASSIVFALQKQQEGKQRTLFSQTMQQAKQKYEEGQGILALNKQAARERFKEARELLVKTRKQLPKEAKEQGELAKLLQQVEEAVSFSSGVSLVDAREVDPKESVLLSHVQTSPTHQLFTHNETSLFAANQKEVISVDKKSGKRASIIHNDGQWSDAVGLGVFGTNVYVLDRTENKILKFVEQKNGYSSANYLASGVKADFARAVGMAVDTSVWVLYSDGTVEKFTRGKPDTLTISGLEQSLKNPTRIFTNTDTDNLYILDRGNSRVVAFAKNGAYQKQYQAKVLGTAAEFDVSEKSATLFVLSEGKVFKLALK